MDVDNFKLFLQYTSYGEHEGNTDIFNKIFFSGYLSPQDSSIKVVSSNFNETFTGLVERLKNESNLDSLCFHHNPQRVKARSARRTNKDVEAVRCIIADIDRPITDQTRDILVETTKPSLLVESSPGKYHVYWTVKPGEIKLEDYSRISLQVAHALGGDVSLKSLAHTLRVPGFPRITKTGERWVPELTGYRDNLLQFDLEAILSLKDNLLFGAMTEQRSGRLSRSDWAPGYSLNGKLNGHALLAEEDELAPPKDSPAFKYYKLKSRHGDKQQISKDEYVKKLLNSAKKGNRHNTLLSAANSHFSTNLDLFHNLPVEEAHELIRKETANLNSLFGEPLDDDELETIITSTIEYTFQRVDAKHERTAQAVAKLTAINEDVEENRDLYEFFLGRSLASEDTYELLATLKFTDEFLAVETLYHHRKNLFTIDNDVYVFDKDKHIWVKQNHLQTGLRELVRKVRESARQSKLFQLKIQKRDKEGVVTGIDTFKAEIENTKLLSDAKLNSITHSLLSSSHMPVKRPEELDANADLIATQTDVVFASSKLHRPKKASDYITTMCSLDYDREADCPFFKKWLKEVFAENESTTEMTEAMQVILGYSFMGIDTGENIFCHIGEGSNGKSMLFKLLTDIAGSYAGRLNGEFLVDTSNKNTYQSRTSMERVLYRVEGKRLIIVDDLKGNNYTWNEEIIKALTDSTGSMRVEGGIAKTIPVRCKVHAAMNEFPRFDSNTDANRRRIYMIPYNRKFIPDAQKKLKIEQQFAKEKAGIFNWIVDGAYKWCNQGLPTVNEMERYTKETLDEQCDWAEKELYEMCFVKVELPSEPADYTDVKKLHQHYKEMKIRTTGNGRNIDSVNTFGRKLRLYLEAEKTKLKDRNVSINAWALKIREEGL